MATEGKEVGAEGNTELPLKYKKWVLKVSVDCEGCKKKIKKILTNIDGVYTTDIDLKQQKVTVIGNVDADTLIKKLLKTRRHAELWPEKAEHKEKKKGKSKNKEKKKEKENEKHAAEVESGEEDEKEKHTVQIEVLDPSNSSEHGSNHKKGDGGNVSNAGEVGPNLKVQTVTITAGNSDDESDSGAEKSTGGSGGKKKKKKKKKKGNKVNINTGEEGEHAGGTPPISGAPAPSQTIGQGRTYPTICIPPHHYGQQHYPHYHAAAVYAHNNVAHPSTSYGAAYYPAPTHPSYSYMQPGTASEGPPSDWDSYSSYSSHQSTSFELLSDENPNACSVM